MRQGPATAQDSAAPPAAAAPARPAEPSPAEPSPARQRTAGRWETGLRKTALTAVLLVTFAAAGCSAVRDSAERAAASATPPATTGPPPGASQAPGPPLSTASAPAGASTPPDGSDPAAVATYCFARWQSFDARTDADLGAGVQRAVADHCFTPDFLAQLTSATGTGATTASPGAGDGEAWNDLRSAGARSTVTVLAATALGDTATTGRVVYLLNARTDYSTNNSTPAQSVSTPTVTLLRDTTGRWQIAGADLSGSAGDAPGR